MPKPHCLIIRSLSDVASYFPPHSALRVNIMFFMLPSPYTHAKAVWVFKWFSPNHFAIIDILKKKKEVEIVYFLLKTGGKRISDIPLYVKGDHLELLP